MNTDLEDWNRIASSYSAIASTRATTSFHELTGYFSERLGTDHQRVLDVGCGDGWLALELSRLGSEIVGVDGSAALLAIARAKVPTGRFELLDLNEGLGSLRDERFDLIVSRFALQCIREPEQMVRDSHHALGMGGRFLVTMPHPVFYGQERVEAEDGDHFRKVRGYLRPHIRRLEDFGGHNYFHRPVHWYVQTFCASGFAMTDLQEVPQTPPWRRDVPEREWTSFERWWLEIPVFLAFEFTKVAPMRR